MLFAYCTYSVHALIVVCLFGMHYVAVIVKATNGPRYVVGCRRQLDKSKLKAGTRVALDMTTLTIMRFFSLSCIHSGSGFVEWPFLM